MLHQYCIASCWTLMHAMWPKYLGRNLKFGRLLFCSETAAFMLCLSPLIFPVKMMVFATRHPSVKWVNRFKGGGEFVSSRLHNWLFPSSPNWAPSTALCIQAAEGRMDSPLRVTSRVKGQQAHPSALGKVVSVLFNAIFFSSVQILFNIYLQLTEAWEIQTRTAGKHYHWESTGTILQLLYNVFPSQLCTIVWWMGSFTLPTERLSLFSCYRSGKFVVQIGGCQCSLSSIGGQGYFRRVSCCDYFSLCLFPAVGWASFQGIHCFQPDHILAVTGCAKNAIAKSSEKAIISGVFKAR